MSSRPRAYVAKTGSSPSTSAFGSRFGIAVILKSRENARIAVSYPTTSGGNRIEVYTRFVWQYYFYLRDQDWGRMFLRICPYFPFNARVCVNQHEWLARRLQEEGVFFRKAANAFVQCSDPDRLQQLADSLTPSDLEVPIQHWLRELVPFYASPTQPHRPTACIGCSAARSSTAPISSSRSAPRSIAWPSACWTSIAASVAPTSSAPSSATASPKPIAVGSRPRSPTITWAIRSFAASTRTAPSSSTCVTTVLLRTEATSYNTLDLGVGKSIRNLPQLRRVMHGINDRYLAIQQDVLETYVDRGQLARLRQPTITAERTSDTRPEARRSPPAGRHAGAHVLRPSRRGGRFRTRDLHQRAAETLGLTTATYRLGQLRYDLAKLRAKGLVVKVPKTQTYRLLAAELYEATRPIFGGITCGASSSAMPFQKSLSPTMGTRAGGRHSWFSIGCGATIPFPPGQRGERGTRRAATSVASGGAAAGGLPCEGRRPSFSSPNKPAKTFSNIAAANTVSPRQGFRICVLFLKLFHRVYAPFSAATFEPVTDDALLPEERRCTLDHLYADVDHAVDQLLDHLGFSLAA